MSLALTYSIVCYTSCSLSLILNITVLYLVAKRTPNVLKDFRWFLCNLTVSDILVSTLITVIQGRQIPRGALTAVQGTGPLKYFGPWAMFCAYSFLGTLLLYISLWFSLLFIYRYIILCKRPILGHLITNRNIVIVLCLVFLVWLFDFILALNAGVPIDEILAKLNETDPGVYFNRDELFANDFSSLNAATVCVSFTALVCFLSYGIVIFCARRIISALNRQVSSMSTSTRERHLSLTRALIIQALLPMVSVVPSLVSFIISMFFQNKYDFQDYLGNTLLLLMTVCDPLLTILFVRPYRTVIFSWLNNKVSAVEIVGPISTRNI